MAVPTKIKALLYSVITLAAAAFIYWHLYTGGWLTNPYYRLNDPDIVNLVLAIVEPLMALAVIAYWLRPTRTFYRLLFASFILQLLICAGFAAFLIFFALTWHPRLM
jgi:hypothetical protein